MNSDFNSCAYLGRCLRIQTESPSLANGLRWRDTSRGAIWTGVAPLALIGQSPIRGGAPATATRFIFLPCVPRVPWASTPAVHGSEALSLRCERSEGTRTVALSDLPTFAPFTCFADQRISLINTPFQTKENRAGINPGPVDDYYRVFVSVAGETASALRLAASVRSTNFEMAPGHRAYVMNGIRPIDPRG